MVEIRITSLKSDYSWNSGVRRDGAGDAGVNMVISGSQPNIQIRNRRSVISNKHNCHLYNSQHNPRYSRKYLPEIFQAKQKYFMLNQR